MFKKRFLILFLLAVPLLMQASDFKSGVFNRERLEINRTAMIVLGGWAVGTILISGFKLHTTEGEIKAFHQMNVGWNIINLAFAGYVYYISTIGNTDLALIETIRQQEGIKRILLLNAGLDLAYIVGGAYLRIYGRHVKQPGEKLRGFGRSVILQGTFLFLFDLILFFIHRHHGHSQLYEMLGDLHFY